MCKAFALGGAHVVIASRKLDACELLAAEIDRSPDCNGRALPVAFNASDWEECNRLVEHVYQEFGRIDVLVNNAGGSPLYPSLSEISEELFDSKPSWHPKSPFSVSIALRFWWLPMATYDPLRLAEFVICRGMGRNDRLEYEGAVSTQCCCGC